MMEQSLDNGLLNLKVGRSRGFRAYYRAVVMDGLSSNCFYWVSKIWSSDDGL